VRHFALRVCEAPHTLARGYRASAGNAGCEMGRNQLMSSDTLAIAGVAKNDIAT